MTRFRPEAENRSRLTYALEREYLVKRKGRISSLRVLIVFGREDLREEKGGKQIILGTAFRSPFTVGRVG